MKLIIQNYSQANKALIYYFEDYSEKTIDSLYTDLNIDKKNSYLISEGKILKENYPLNDYNNKIIEIRIRLKGGKGGFGTSLRLQQATKKQTKNFDACRDLQGRRLRKINQERQLNEWRMKKVEEEKLLKKYIEGYNTNEEDLFKKIMDEKRNIDAIRKNQKFYEDNENLKFNIQKSIKIFLNKKREGNDINNINIQKVKENIEKEKNDNNIIKAKKIRKFKGIKKKKISEDENNEIKKINVKKENEYINEIKNMKNEDDLFDAILF